MNSALLGLLLIFAADSNVPPDNTGAAVASRRTITVVAGLKVGQEFPFVFSISTAGGSGATAFKFKDGWALTAAHNVNNCELHFRVFGDMKVGRCWNHPGLVDIAACYSPEFPGGRVEYQLDFSGIDDSGTGQFVVAGFGCSGGCADSNYNGPVDLYQSAGALKFLVPRSDRQLVDLRSIENLCTQVCGGDSGGPVFAVLEKKINPAQIPPLDAVKLGNIKGVISGKLSDEGSYRISTVTSFSQTTKLWLDSLQPNGATLCESGGN